MSSKKRRWWWWLWHNVDELDSWDGETAVGNRRKMSGRRKENFFISWTVSTPNECAMALYKSGKKEKLLSHSFIFSPRQLLLSQVKLIFFLLSGLTKKKAKVFIFIFTQQWKFPLSVLCCGGTQKSCCSAAISARNTTHHKTRSWSEQHRKKPTRRGKLCSVQIGLTNWRIRRAHAESQSHTSDSTMSR